MSTARVRMVTEVSCGHCGSSVHYEYDEGWYCRSCNVFWGQADPFNEDALAEWDDLENERCNELPRTPMGEVKSCSNSRLRTITYRDYNMPCDLPKGHEMTMFGHNNHTHIIYCEESA